MLERFVICDNGIENCFQNGLVTGYKVKIGLPYYRSIPLSCIEEISLSLNSEKINPDSITLELNGAEYSLSDLDRMDIWWNFLDKGYLKIKKDGDLIPGKYNVKVHFNIRIPYLIPVGDKFVANYDVTNAVKTLEVIS